MKIKLKYISECKKYCAPLKEQMTWRDVELNNVKSKKLLSICSIFKAICLFILFSEIKYNEVTALVVFFCRTEYICNSETKISGSIQDGNDQATAAGWVLGNIRIGHRKMSHYTHAVFFLLGCKLPRLKAIRHPYIYFVYVNYGEKVAGKLQIYCGSAPAIS